MTLFSLFQCESELPSMPEYSSVCLGRWLAVLEISCFCVFEQQGPLSSLLNWFRKEMFLPTVNLIHLSFQPCDLLSGALHMCQRNPEELLNRSRLKVMCKILQISWCVGFHTVL